jgi:hypothetical protein
VALKKPSEYFKKDQASVGNSFQNLVKEPELNTFSDAFESFKNNLGKIEVLSEFSKTFENYNDNIEKVNHLSEKVDEIKTEIENLLKKEDLDRAMLSQLLVVEQSIRDVQNKVKSINEKNLTEIRLDVSGLTESVNNFLDIEVPKYRKLVVESELRTNNRYEELEKNVSQTLQGIGEFVDSKYVELTETLHGINEESIASIIEDFKSLDSAVLDLRENEIPNYKDFIVEEKIKTETKLNEFSEKVDEKVNLVENSIQEIEEKFDYLKSEEIPNYKNFIVEEKIKTETKLNEFDEKLNKIVNSLLEKISNVEGDKIDLVNVVNQKIQEILSFKNSIVEDLKDSENNKNELDKKIKNLEVEIIRNESHIKVQNKNIENLKEDVRDAIGKLKIDELEYKNNKLAKKIKYIEEVFEKFNEKEILSESIIVEPSSVDNQDPLTPLDQNFVTLNQLQQHYRLFLNRIQQQLATVGGGGETRLKYLDDIVGIATNASAYDNKYLKYNHSIEKFVFEAVPTTDDISEENIIYVAKDGDDLNSGSLTNPKLTIKSAVSEAVANNVIRVAPGTYYEDNPITLPDDITIMGHSLRETTIIPLNPNEDLFYVGKGNYIAEMSFKGSLPGKAIFAFDPIKLRYIDQSPYVQNCTNFIPDSIGMRIDGNDAIGPLKSMVLDSYTQYNQGGIGVSITNGAYAQLVSLFTICNDIAVYCGSGGACDLTNSNSSFGNYGLVADGVSSLKYSGVITQNAIENSDTFVLDLSTPVLNVSNAIYDNLTGIVTITTSANHGFYVGMGVTISDLEFTCPSGPGIVTYPSGNYGYVFDVESIPALNQFSVNVGPSTLPHTYNGTGGTVSINVVRPFDGQAVYFNELFYTVKRLKIIDGGSGFTEPPTITIDPPSEPWGVRAEAAPIIENGVLVGVDMISNGRGYEFVPSVEVSAGINTAEVVAELVPEYYTIQKASEIVGGLSIITLNENVPFEVGIGTVVNFYKQSRVLATGHSFEFIGSGTDISSCLPFTGGVPIDDNETDSRGGGLVVYSSTNQSGNFKIGDGVTINQNTSSITGSAYTKSLLSTMTPYILSLGGL